jgi:hypothetical protein
MLRDFLNEIVTIEREQDSIYDGDVLASLVFTQLPEASFLSISVSGATSLTAEVSGTHDGLPVSEQIEISGAIGNRGFQKFDSLTSISCTGVLAGKIKISLLNDQSEPIFFSTEIGAFSTYSATKFMKRGLGAFGEVDSLSPGRMFYFEPSVDVQRHDILVQGIDKFRCEDTKLLKSILGTDSHIEVLTSKVVSKREFE